MGNLIYKAFSLLPYKAENLKGEVVNLIDVLSKVASDVQLVTDSAQWLICEGLREAEAIHGSKTQAAEVGRQLGVKADPIIFEGKKSGNSRLEKMIQGRAIRECRSWTSRKEVTESSSSRYVSQGWKRTANANKPQTLKPKMSLSDTDKRYTDLRVEDDSIVLKMVIGGDWHILYFRLDTKRFNGFKKITKPDVTIDSSGLPIFHFTAAYEYNYVLLSNRYVVSVDVGVSQFVTLSVFDYETRSIVRSSTLSQKVHSLYNKVRKTNTQVSSLRKQNRRREARRHREANTRRKRELAIIAGQEIETIAYDYDALAVFEDLSWISNTIQNGRWNRAELMKRTTEFVEQNGSRVMTTSAYRTSQDCYKCGGQLTFLSWHEVVCVCDGAIEDRDVNATANIALRFEKAHANSVATRKKSKRLVNRQPRRSKGSPLTLKYPGRDRTKSTPTPSRPKSRKEVKNMCPARTVKKFQGSVRVMLDVPVTRVSEVVTQKAAQSIRDVSSAYVKE